MTTPDDMAEAERAIHALHAQAWTLACKRGLVGPTTPKDQEKIDLLAQHFARVREEAYARGKAEGKHKEGAD